MKCQHLIYCIDRHCLTIHACHLNQYLIPHIDHLLQSGCVGCSNSRKRMDDIKRLQGQAKKKKQLVVEIAREIYKGKEN